MGNLSNGFYEEIKQLKSKALRDISYLVCSADLQHPLIKEELYYPTFQLNSRGPFGLNYYQDLTEKEIELLESIDPKTALGRYAERLLAAWFLINPNYEVLAFNLQLIEEGKTLGEIDLLLWEKRNRRAIHLEFALKFYLAHQLDQKWEFTGPKGRDTLEGKSRKLIDHQMKLCQDQQHLLPDGLANYQYKAQLMMKGCIFYPFSLSAESNKWIRRSEISSLHQWPNAHFGILEKRSDWIFPFDEMESKVTLDSIFLNQELRRKKLPLMLVYKKEEEIGLLMIVEDSWPHIKN